MALTECKIRFAVESSLCKSNRMHMNIRYFIMKRMPAMEVKKKNNKFWYVNCLNLLFDE